MDLSKRIREIRISKDLKQSEMAQKMGITQSNYSRLESKGNDISINELLKVAKTFEISVIELLGGVGGSVDSFEMEKLRKENETLKKEIEELKELDETAFEFGQRLIKMSNDERNEYFEKLKKIESKNLKTFVVYLALLQAFEGKREEFESDKKEKKPKSNFKFIEE